MSIAVIDRSGRIRTAHAALTNTGAIGHILPGATQRQLPLPWI